VLATGSTSITTRSTSRSTRTRIPSGRAPRGAAFYYNEATTSSRSPLRRRRGEPDHWETYSSARGTLLELIKSGAQLPPGLFIFEDPPLHDLHRGLLSRVFTPRQDERHRAQVASSVPAASTRWSVPEASTSSPTSAPRCRCGRSACSSDPRAGPGASAIRSTRACASRTAPCPSSERAQELRPGEQLR